MSNSVNDTENGELTTKSSVQFDIKKFVYKLIGFLPFIILSILIAYTVGKLYLRYTPQMHKVVSYLLIKDQEESSPDYNVLRELGVITSGKEVQNQMDILQSYELSEGIVDSLNLQVKVFTQGRISSQPLYGHTSPVFVRLCKNDSAQYLPTSYELFLYNDKFKLVQGKESHEYKYKDTFLLSGRQVTFIRNPAVKADNNGYTLVIQDKHSVAVTLRASIGVSKVHDPGGIVEIATQDQSAERAIDIINKLVEAYNTAGITDKNLVGFKTRHFLNDRVDTVAKELDGLEKHAEEFKSANHITDIDAAGAQYLTEATKYDEMQVQQTGKLKLLESLEDFIKSSKDYTDIIPSQFGLDESTLIDLIKTYNNSIIDYQEQIKISTKKDPIVDRLKNKITEQKSNILKNIESIRKGYETNASQISLQKNDYENLLSSIPEKEREYLKLKRQIGVKEQLYLYLLQKKEEVELSLNSTMNNTRVVDSAYDQGVVSPKADQVMTFALILGFVIPILVMLLLDFFDNKIADRMEIEQKTRVPVIGELSFNKNIKNTIIHSKSRSSMAEQFRLLGTNLRYIASDKESKIVIVTSFMSGEGKSFVSTNLSCILSTSGAKVLLLELDLRKPKLSKYLSIEPKFGLTDYLVNSKSPEEIITKLDKYPNLDIITSGPVPPNPTEMLLHEKLASLFKAAREKYQYIIIDSSPVGLVADTMLLGPQADVALFILRHRYSLKTTISYIDKLNAEQKFKNLSIVVNGIKEQKGVGYTYGYSYGYSYGYGYGYSYGSGYYPEDEKPSKWRRMLPWRKF